MRMRVNVARGRASGGASASAVCVRECVTVQMFLRSSCCVLTGMALPVLHGVNACAFTAEARRRGFPKIHASQGQHRDYFSPSSLFSLFEFKKSKSNAFLIFRCNCVA